MSNSVSKELALVKELMQEGKLEEALQLVEDIEKKENPTPKEMLRTLAYKTKIYSDVGKFEIAFKISEELYQKSQEMKLSLFSLDALFLREWVLLAHGRFEEAFKTFELYENLLNSIPRDDSLEYQKREVNFLITKANINFHKANLDLALKDHEKSLTLLEKISPNSSYLSTILTLMAYTYQTKGELKLSLEYSEKALSQLPKGEHYFPMTNKADIYRNMGGIYYIKGDLNRGLEYQKYALEIYKKFKISWRLGWAYNSIINILLAKKDFNQARNYLQKFKQITEKPEYHVQTSLYQLTKARILRTGSAVRDHDEAENILKQIVKDESIRNIWLRFFALASLCDLYFEKIQLTNQMDLLDNIQPLIDQIQRDSLQVSSFWTLAMLKLFQAKLALLQINMVGARKLLTEAQQIADEHGLKRLVGVISSEHDKLLAELKLWESIKNTKAPVSERLKLASIDDVLERMRGRGVNKPLESSDEQPVLLLILAEGGVLLFSYPFTDKWKRDEDLFGGFLSAFSIFSDEFFSQGLDRAKFGNDTILLKSVGSFSICYLFQGQTYFAKQKLEKFAETLQKNTSIWGTLEKFEKSSQVAELIDLPEMESLLNNSFRRK